MPVNSVEADFAKRMAQMLSKLLEGGIDLPEVKVVLSEYLEFQEKPDAEKTAKVRVFFGEKLAAGTVPDEFAFGTKAESEAFVQGISAFIGRGTSEYRICTFEDEVVMADGEIRRLPDNIDAEGAVVLYEMLSADACARTIVYGMDTAGQVVEIDPGSWAPTEPVAETTAVNVTVHQDTDEWDIWKITGDQHRDLENSGVLHDFLTLLAKNDPDGAEELFKEVCAQGAKP